MDLFKKIYFSKPVYNYKKEWFLLLTIFLFILLRLPSLVEPHWYGDEGIYQVVGRAMREGRILYKDIWDNKPPLLYLVYAVFNGDLFWVKLSSLITGAFTVLAFYSLAEKLFRKNSAIYLSTFVFAVIFGLPLIEGNIANAENFMLLPIIISANYIFKYLNERNTKYLITAGILISLGALFKVVAVFDFLALFIYLNISIPDEHIKRIYKTLEYKIKESFIFIIAGGSLFLVSLFYFIASGAVGDFVKGVFSQNVGYVGYENGLFFPMGILVIKTLILAAFLLLVFKLRKKLGNRLLFIYLWFFLALYSSFFSQRPYTHYLLVVLPAASLLFGNIFSYKKTRIFGGIMIGLIIFLAINYFQIYRKTLYYYGNYLGFMLGTTSVTNYESFFDTKTPRDYNVAGFIDAYAKKTDNVFLWSDNAQIYALSHRLPIGKYIVAYHITFYKNADMETEGLIEKIRPRFIIQTTDVPFLKDMLSSYQLRYQIEGAKVYEREI